MPCEISDRDRRIDDFLMNQLTPADAEAFEIHLFGCKECLAALRLREQMIEVLREETMTAVAGAARPWRVKALAGPLGTIAGFLKVRPNAWVYAAAAVLLLVAAFSFSIFYNQKTPESFAANFIPSPQFESLMKQAQRSSFPLLSVASPRSGEKLSSREIEFRWQILTGNDPVDSPLELKILNNQERLVHSARVKGYEYRLSETLVPGLYYWALEYRGEMLHFDKFFFIASRH